MKVLLLSTYELGRQPFGLASPAAWLRQHHYQVTTCDTAVEPIPYRAISEADLIACYVPMHTATRLAIALLPEIKQLNPTAHLCFYGLYAPLNEVYLRKCGVNTILGGEFEEGLLRLCQRLEKAASNPSDEISNFFQPEPVISLNRQQFLKPDRNGLPPLSEYARLCRSGCQDKIVGYVEATRGCKHHCRHCPIVPVYNGKFRVIQKAIVLADIRQQVEAGAQHITFGDPDFFNGPGHTLPIVEQMHHEFPGLTYDVTIKIEHLLRYRDKLPRLKETGCLLVTSAVESLDDRILYLLEKRHTREDFFRALTLLRQYDLALNPTFIPFTPWTTLQGYRDLLRSLCEWDLVDYVSPIQLAIRLLIPAGSRLLALPEIRAVLGKFREEKLSFEWRNPDPLVEELHIAVMEIVNNGLRAKQNSREMVSAIWHRLNLLTGESLSLPPMPELPARAAIPYLNEPWYC